MNNLNKTTEYAKEIKDWFASEKDFDEGFVLFVRFSHNRALAMQLSRKRTQSKLEYELQKILERGLIIERPVMPIGMIKKAVAPVVEKQQAVTTDLEETGNKVETVGKLRVVMEDKIDYDSFTDEQKALWDANRDMHKEMRSWHEKMKLAKTDEERAEYRSKVIELEDQIKANYKILDGDQDIHSNEDKTKETDPFKAVNNARSYLSKNLPKLETLTGKKLDELKAKVTERYQVLIDAGQALDETSISKLKACGIIVE